MEGTKPASPEGKTELSYLELMAYFGMSRHSEAGKPPPNLSSYAILSQGCISWTSAAATPPPGCTPATGCWLMAGVGL
jgi:hypothetical protein